MGESGAATGRVVIVMPTYNERQNLEGMASRIRESVPDADLLVVDDNSPDGTGDLADKLAEADPHVQVMHRTEKAGLGRAYVAGFTWALERGYDLIVEMDADGSHRPEDLPKLLAAVTRADAVIGSRYVPGGTVVNWPKSREILSRGRQPLQPADARRPDQGRDRRVPRVQGRDAAQDRPDLDRLGRLLLPDRHDAPGAAGGPGADRGADHLRRARARRLEDVQLRHHRGRSPGWRSGASRPACTATRPPRCGSKSGPAHASTPRGERPPGFVRLYARRSCAGRDWRRRRSREPRPRAAP